MKTKLLLIFVMCWGEKVFGQIEIRGNEIIVNADSKVKSFETNIEYEKGQKHYVIKSKNPKGNSISIKTDATLQDKLNTEEKNSTPKSNDEVEIGNITFGRNTELTITISADDDPKERIYIIKTKTNWSWTTTFGANAIFFSNRNKFISQEANDGTQQVAEVRDRKQMELMPTIMFTFMNNHNDFPFGVSGGLGVNFEEISVFSGISLGIGQNIILTGGVGVHKQTRPNSIYSVGQAIDSSVTIDNLNESQYRVNPFIGISFRLDKNPFGKKAE